MYEGAEEMEINPSDEEQMAKCLPATRLQEVWTDMGNLWIMPLDTHRTLQREPDTVFVEWFGKSRKRLCILKRAKMVYSRYSLPYI